MVRLRPWPIKKIARHCKSECKLMMIHIGTSDQICHLDTTLLQLILVTASGQRMPVPAREGEQSAVGPCWQAAGSLMAP